MAANEKVGGIAFGDAMSEGPGLREAIAALVAEYYPRDGSRWVKAEMAAEAIMAAVASELAAARAKALEEAAKVCDKESERHGWHETYNGLRLCIDLAESIRALSGDTATGGGRS